MNNKKQSKGMSALGIGIGAASSALGMIGQDARAKKQHERQKELMDLQNQQQERLNKQGSQLQYDMWKKTSYPGQMEMMKEAGLNPALMYGMSGGGGVTTGSQGGGSAAGGSSHAPMDIGAIAQVGLLKAQTEKLKAETDNIAGKTGLQESEKSNINASTVKMTEEGIKLNMENDVKFQTLSDEIKRVKMEALGAELDNQLKGVSKKLTEEQTRALSHKIWQEWVKTGSFATGALGGIIGNALKGLFKNQ